MEYDYAVEIGIPILGFVKRDVTSVPAKFSEMDPQKRVKLDSFRAKVQSRTCRMYENPSELGMYIMKSLVSETRTNPQIGWIRADQARSEEDDQREQALAKALAQSEKNIKKLERQLRDKIILPDEIGPERLSKGSDKTNLTIIYQDLTKRMTSSTIEFSWDEIFAVIGASMYGYIVRRAERQIGQPLNSYSFESNLVEFIRVQRLNDYGNRQIKLLQHEIDAVLIQFKQLGYIELHDKEQADGSTFRGYMLTTVGEQHLTRIKSTVL